MEDRMEVEITGRATLLLVGMAALVEAEITGEVVLLLEGMVALVGAEITGEADLLVGMGALVEAEITGRADILLAAMTEVAEEDLRQPETLMMLQSLDGKLQQGRAEPPLVQVKDEVLTAMMVRFIRAVIIAFRLPTLCCAFVSTRSLGCIFLPSSRGDPRARPTPHTSMSTIITATDSTTTGSSCWLQHISAAN